MVSLSSWMKIKQWASHGAFREAVFVRKTVIKRCRKRFPDLFWTAEAAAIVISDLFIVHPVNIQHLIMTEKHCDETNNDSWLSGLPEIQLGRLSVVSQLF